MDINNLSKTEVITYSSAYTLVAFMLGFDPNDEYRGNTKKLRKKLSQAILLEIDYENPIFTELCELENDEEFTAFFKACYIAAVGYDEERTRNIEKICVDYPENEKQAFKELFTQNVFPDAIKYYDDKLEISLDDKNSYTEKLVLEGVNGFEKHNETEYLFVNAEVSPTPDGASVSCPIDIYADEAATEKCVNFTFKSIKCELQIFAADELNIFDKPFDALCIAAEDVCDKAKLGDECLNEKEKQLLPILYELASINNIDYDPVNFDDTENKAYAKRFPLLKELAAEYGLKKVVKKITVLENFANDTKKGFSKSLKLFEALNMIECEPLWRKIFNDFRESQSAYPKRGHNIEDKHYNEIVQEIEEKLHACGYSGSYPDFYKNGALRGVRLAKSYNLSYFIVNEKNTEHFIHCKENNCENEFSVDFLCGIAILKKGESAEDVYSCSFNANGKRLFETVSYCEPQPDDEDYEYEESASLSEMLTIAVKKAECRRLNSAEKKLYYGSFGFGFRLFELVVFTLCVGGAFAVLFTLGMMLFTFVLTLAIDGVSTAVELLREFPWHLMALFTGLGFGCAMSVVEALASRK